MGIAGDPARFWDVIPVLQRRGLMKADEQHHRFRGRYVAHRGGDGGKPECAGRFRAAMAIVASSGGGLGSMLVAVLAKRAEREGRHGSIRWSILIKTCPALPAFALIRRDDAVSYWASRSSRGRLHGAIRHLIGLLMSVLAGGKNGVSDIPLLSGVGLMGGAMLRDFAIVATAFGVRLEFIKGGSSAWCRCFWACSCPSSPVARWRLRLVIGRGEHHHHHRRRCGDLHHRPGDGQHAVGRETAK